MDYWQHARLSAKKFGGRPQDYLAVHRFIDSGKLFRYHIKHRLLLHNLYGVELAIQLFGDHSENSDGQITLIRDVVHAHCREDLGGRVPSLGEWLGGVILPDFDRSRLPPIQDRDLEAFLYKPYLRSGLDSALAITFSDFGVHLVETFFGFEPARALAETLAPLPSVGKLLDAFSFGDSWQYSPRKHEIQWLSSDN